MKKGVTLTEQEIFMGAMCGVMRNIASLDRPDANGFRGDFGWNAHIEGACGEIAVAKILKRFWSPTVNVFHAPDIGLNIQVRTRLRHSYDLIVRPGDDQDHAFVLVTGKVPFFIVRGYLRGRDARRKKWSKTHGSRPAAWFVPQSALLPWQELRRIT